MKYMYSLFLIIYKNYINGHECSVFYALNITFLLLMLMTENLAGHEFSSLFLMVLLCQLILL